MTATLGEHEGVHGDDAESGGGHAHSGEGIAPMGVEPGGDDEEVGSE